MGPIRELPPERLKIVKAEDVRPLQESVCIYDIGSTVIVSLTGKHHVFAGLQRCFEGHQTFCVVSAFETVHKLV